MTVLGKFVPLLPAGTLVLSLPLVAGAVVASPAAAEQPPPLAPAARPPDDKIPHFLGAAIPGTNFIASASRMAVVYAQSSKLRDIARDLAKDQTAAANSLASWVNVSGPVVTRQFPYSGRSSAAKVTAPRLLPAQVNDLRQLSQLRGKSFDEFYLSRIKETLGQLGADYAEFGKSGQDAGLKAIAQQQLPKVEKTISALDAM